MERTGAAMAHERVGIRVVGVRVHFIPVRTRVPLKFGAETLTEVTCARACVKVRSRDGRVAEGWGETPLSVQWAWPGPLPYETRHRAMKSFCRALARAWLDMDVWGHPLEIGHAFLNEQLAGCVSRLAAESSLTMPHLAALVCCSAFDIALYDAFGKLIGKGVYQTLDAAHLSRDLSAYLAPASGADVSFQGMYPSDFLVARQDQLAVWHLVGGKDPLEPGELLGDEPRDGYPVLLRDWIARDGLECLKIKLRGNDAAWDYQRLVRVGGIAQDTAVRWLSADFNCTVTEAAYVNCILDRLRDERPRTYGMLLYVEQPFPYDLEENRIDVHSVSARKPLFMDESAHDWQLVRLGRGLGWNGVALKTCKTQTGALLSLCWARAHGMSLMVQDLTNPMLAQIPHVLLAAHAGTIMGVESNGMQFYPEASAPEAAVHPRLYRRRNGQLDLTTLQGPGYGYALDRIVRELPPAAACVGE